MFDPESDHPAVLDVIKQLGYYTDCYGKANWSEPFEVVEEMLAKQIMLTAEVLAIIIASALKMANTWQKFVILRAGKLRGVKGPGLFLIIPVIDHVVAVIDERIQTTAFSAEEALTKDTVPVNVDAIIFWFVHDAQKAALNITNYREAIDRVSQTSLREMIGSSMLSALLSERTAADELLRGEMGRKTADWGISVKSVEIRDVAIPVALQDAMSRQAQAEREKQARVILGSAEAAIAGKFVEAAMTYADYPAALQLRAMNIIYETTKERGATILIPTSMVDSMNPVVALALTGQDAAPKKANGPAPLSPSARKDSVTASQAKGREKITAATLSRLCWLRISADSA
jgi:regulator of protease activity HflC (stomatin/prohibitin superfamily)